MSDQDADPFEQLHQRVRDRLGEYIQQRNLTVEGRGTYVPAPRDLAKEYANIAMEVFAEEKQNLIADGVAFAANTVIRAINRTRERHKSRGTFPTGEVAINEARQIARALKRRAEEGRTLYAPDLEAAAITTSQAPPNNPDTTPPKEGTPE